MRVRSALRLGTVAASFAAFALAASPALAETPKEKADALFREGRTASQNGDYATACAKFAESQQLDSSVGTQLNLGDCSEHLGKWTVARAYFRDAIIKLDPSDARVVQARERLKVLEPKIPKLTVTISSASPAGTTVRCDGRAIAEAEVGAPIPVDPGEHTCVAVAPGHAEATQSVTVKESSQATLEIAAGAEVPVDPKGGTVPPIATQTTPSSKRTIGWVVGGIGVAGLAVAGITGLVILGEKSAADSGCQNKTNCNADAQSAISANKTWLPVNTIAWIVGAVGVGVGAYLILTSTKDGTPTTKVGALSARVGATMLPGGGGVNAMVTF